MATYIRVSDLLPTIVNNNESCPYSSIASPEQLMRMSKIFTSINTTDISKTISSITVPLVVIRALRNAHFWELQNFKGQFADFDPNRRALTVPYRRTYHMHQRTNGISRWHWCCICFVSNSAGHHTKILSRCCQDFGDIWTSTLCTHRIFASDIPSGSPAQSIRGRCCYRS